MSDKGALPGPADKEFWQGRWRTGQTGWDFGRADPLLPRLIEVARAKQVLHAGARILEPGCGRAHNGAALAQLDDEIGGYHVTAFDAVEEAIAGARALYGNGQVRHLTLVVGDALRVNSEWLAVFDAVFDRAMLCALPPDLRNTYLRNCFAYLRPGGVLLSLPFAQLVDATKSGPPFAMSAQELQQALNPGFTQLFLEEHRVGDDRIAKMFVSIWCRREAWLEEGGA